LVDSHKKGKSPYRNIFSFILFFAFAQIVEMGGGGGGTAIAALESFSLFFQFHEIDEFLVKTNVFTGFFFAMSQFDWPITKNV